MKYLLENTEYEKEQTLKEICYDLTDEGFDIEFDHERFYIDDLNNTGTILTINKYRISGEKDFGPTGTKINISIKMDDNLKETIFRIVDYLGNDLVKIFVNVNFSAYGFSYIVGEHRSLMSFLNVVSDEKINFIYIYYK